MATRSYERNTIWALGTLSGNRCSFPNCPEILLQPGPKGLRMVGEVAHLVALKEDGPRGSDPTMSVADRNALPNLTLMCGYHHQIIDGDVETYPIDVVRRIKADHEAEVILQQTRMLPKVGFRELDEVVNAIIDKPSESSEIELKYTVEEKIDRNSLSGRHRDLILAGMSKFTLVGEYVKVRTESSYYFSQKLVGPFKREYERLYSMGLRSDTLFSHLQGWAAGHQSEWVQQSASIAVLSYMFATCEVMSD